MADPVSAQVGAYAEAAQIIGGILSATTDAIITLAPTKYDKARKKRINTLQDMMESGQLGMTESQLDEIQNISQLGTAAAEKEFYGRQADVLRTAETTPQAVRLGQQAAQEALRAQRSELNRQVLAAERQAELQQIAELQALQEEQRAREEEKKAAVAKFLSAGLISTGKAVEASERNKQLLGTNQEVTLANQLANQNSQNAQKATLAMKQFLNREPTDDELERYLRYMATA